jgi:hypothetical protein
MSAAIKIACQAPGTALTRKALELLRRTIRERSGVPVATAHNADVVLDIRPGVGREGFSIEGDPGGDVRIVGNDERGLIYGVGKFLRTSGFDPGKFTPSRWRGRSVPAKPVRGMYLATHFHNFYHDAPVKEVCRYIEELALWGCNALSVWFDMHHYDGMSDPAATKMAERLRTILTAANEVGMGACLGTIANEGFNNSPQALRADWTAGHDGYFAPPGAHYQREICPSKSGGMEEILRTRREVFEALSGVNMEYVWFWPYDQGGCTCSQCAPWGSNGFLRCARKVADLTLQFWPQAKMILSTWYFDLFTSGEWEGLTRAFAAQAPTWISSLMADGFGGFPQYPLRRGVPGGLPMIGFPEISMQRMWPWGGFGANPRPLHWQDYWDTVGPKLAGVFPYSEGIFEDINKAITFGLNWSPDRTTADIIREYAAYEFSPRAAHDVVTACQLMETCMDHFMLEDSEYEEFMEANDGLPAGALPQGRLYRLRRLFEPKRYLRLLNRAEAKMPVHAKRSWRWRVLWLRAALDAELHDSGGQVTRNSERHFKELAQIYHSERAERADRALQPASYSFQRRLYLARKKRKT